jgi:hypothetical protein
MNGNFLRPLSFKTENKAGRIVSPDELHSGFF